MMTEPLDAPSGIGGPSPTAGSDSADPAGHAHRMAVLGTLAGGIAHDFNNLLQVISGYADVVQASVDSGAVDLARLGRASEAIRAATDRATELTRKLLDFSREQGSAGRVVSLNSVVEDMRQAIGQTIGEGIELRTALAPELQTAVIDPAELRAALFAVLTNARDATPAGGRIVVRTENVPLEDRKAALLQGVPAGRYVAVSVSDTGSGMPPESLIRATEPFFSTKEPGKADGLGLALVDRFAKRAKGAVRISSTVGCGTTVRLLLPVQDAASSDEHATSL